MGMIDKSGMIYELEKPNDIRRYSNDEIVKSKRRFKYYFKEGKHKEDLRELALIDHVLRRLSKTYNLKYHREKIN